MVHALIPAVAVSLLVVVLYHERRDAFMGLLFSKTALSALFVLTALIQPHPLPRYYHLLLTGLLLCLGGDICLVFRQRPVFLAGLVLFLLGHVFFILSFFHLARPGTLTWAGTALAAILSAAVFLRLSPHLGSMKLPVLAYVVVITAMVSGALSVLGDTRYPLGGRVMVFAGAWAFYVSDIFVARDRFVRESFLNRLAGLPLYYGGQFLLAFSVGFLAA